MIQQGSTAIVQIRNAIYSPCRIVLLHTESVVVTYFKGMKKDRKTGKMVEDHRVDTIPRSEIVSLQKRT